MARMPAAQPFAAEPLIAALPRPRRARIVRLAQRLHALKHDATQAETLHALALACEAETAFIAELDAPACAWRVVMSACGAGALLDAREWPADALPELARQLRRAGLASVARGDATEDGALLARSGLGRLTVVALDSSRTTVLGLCLHAEAPAPDAAERALLTLAAVRIGAERRLDAARAAAARAEERLALTVHGAAAGWFEWDLEAGRIEWSPRLRALFGYDADDPPEAALWHDLVDPADLAQVERAVSAHFDGATDHFDETFRARRKDGSCFWAWVRFQAARGAQGQLKRAVGTVLDVSAQQRVEAELAAEHARMRTTLAAIADGVVSVDAAGRIDYMNPAAERLIGAPVASALGKPVEQVVPLGAALGRALERCVLLGSALPLAEAPLGGVAGRFVAGTVAPLGARAAAGSSDGGAVVVFRDVSEARALRERLAHQASHDPLTGLINRRELDARLARAVASAKRDGRAHAFLYLDLDQFKLLNDACGHAAGDALLAKLGAALQAAVPPGATVARLGGDEFGVLLPDCELARAARVAETLRGGVAGMRFEWDGRVFRLGASLGAVAIDAARGSAAEVLAAADIACYAAKDAGRDRVHASAAGDATLARRRRDMDWVRRIDATLEQGAPHGERFVLLRQPIVALRGGGAPHHELLLRHLDASGRSTAPEAFIGAAERYGLMPRLDRWVVTRALAWLASRPDLAGMHAVNLSGQALADRRFHGFVREALAQARVAPERLCVEITETSAIADLDATARFLRGLRGLGCRTALDDFGTGLASFTYLKRLPLDLVKVDGNFVRGVGAAGVDREVIRAVQAVAGALGVATVAECVEDQACLEQLRDLGVDYAQGWAVGRPEPLPETSSGKFLGDPCIPPEQTV